MNHHTIEVSETCVSTKLRKKPVYKGTPGYGSSTVGLHGTGGVVSPVLCVRSCLGTGSSIAYILARNYDSSQSNAFEVTAQDDAYDCRPVEVVDSDNPQVAVTGLGPGQEETMAQVSPDQASNRHTFPASDVDVSNTPSSHCNHSICTFCYSTSILYTKESECTTGCRSNSHECPLKVKESVVYS